MVNSWFVAKKDYDIAGGSWVSSRGEDSLIQPKKEILQTKKETINEVVEDSDKPKTQGFLWNMLSTRNVLLAGLAASGMYFYKRFRDYQKGLGPV